jgi:capsular polysaccharide transport system ATP-binding protein
MIYIENLTKAYVKGVTRTVVLDDITVVLPSKVSIGLMGRNGAGKSTLLDLLSGASAPTSGRILTDGQVSFPVGFAGSFHNELTGAQNVRFVGRLYGVDTNSLMDYVEEFAELGQHFHMPLKSYSSGMRSRLSFGLSMGLRFDTYLIDEVTAVGDAAFRRKSEAVFKDRMRTAGAIFVSHSMNALRSMCTAGAVLDGGKLHYYDDIEDAIARHERNMNVAR